MMTRRNPAKVSLVFSATQKWQLAAKKLFCLENDDFQVQVGDHYPRALENCTKTMSRLRKDIEALALKKKKVKGQKHQNLQ